MTLQPSQDDQNNQTGSNNNDHLKRRKSFGNPTVPAIQEENDETEEQTNDTETSKGKKKSPSESVTPTAKSSKSPEPRKTNEIDQTVNADVPDQPTNSGIFASGSPPSTTATANTQNNIIASVQNQPLPGRAFLTRKQSRAHVRDALTDEKLELTLDEVYATESKALPAPRLSVTDLMTNRRMSVRRSISYVVEDPFKPIIPEIPTILGDEVKLNETAEAAEKVTTKKPASPTKPGNLGPGSYNIPDFITISRRKHTISKKSNAESVINFDDLLDKSDIETKLQPSWMFLSKKDRDFPLLSENQKLGPGTYHHQESWPIAPAYRVYGHIFKSKTVRFKDTFTLSETPGPANYDINVKKCRAPDQTPWVHKIHESLGRSKQYFHEVATDFVRPTNAIVNEDIGEIQVRKLMSNTELESAKAKSSKKDLSNLSRRQSMQKTSNTSSKAENIQKIKKTTTSMSQTELSSTVSLNGGGNSANGVGSGSTIKNRYSMNFFQGQ